MAGVQRTRIGYGNEGRTKQLAASLSDFIRLFSLYHPTSPPLKTTQHTKSLVVAPLAGGVGGGCGGGWVGGGGGDVRLSLSLAPPSLRRQLSSLSERTGSRVSPARPPRLFTEYLSSSSPPSAISTDHPPPKTLESSPSLLLLLLLFFLNSQSLFRSVLYFVSR